MKSSLVVAIISAVASAICTQAGNMWYDSIKSQTMYIDYKVDQKPVLAGISDRRDLQINRRRLDGAGVVDLKIYNQTGTSFDSLTLYLILTSKRKNIRGAVIDHDFFDHRGEKINVEGSRTRLYRVDSTDQSITFILQTAPFNYYKDDPALSGKIIINNIEGIETTLQIKKAGVEPRMVSDISNTEVNNSIIVTIYGGIGILVVLVAFFMFMQRIGIVEKILA